METVKYDIELDNAILFGQFIMVMKDERVVGWGMIDAWDENEVKVGDEWYSRKKCSFIVSPAPQTSIFTK
ncbi:hypothetical protein [Paenibacillus sp. Soil750]|uniref:hypothetical protein n=1 Tax=Paenibacillus sp. Soil750 TaxID=1736398 RepID=UPI0006FE42E8|nr:hypothetical protein [Paenibacillus sp. Soil750]KRE56780.1 hypothetical protein ASL11_34050 [Paenibacillus sp. Soil750]